MTFRRSLLAMSIMALGSSALAQTATEEVEEVVVLGVKGAQKSAIEEKRAAASIVDGFSAEDIGKLPDATVTDSLQRITGVQIERSEGEGSAVSIRGMQQITTMLNGEQFLGAGNLTAAQPNLNDIPAQLLNGAAVFKSLDVRNASSGITGTINLTTYRPMSFKEGLTTAVGVEAERGELTKKNDATTNFLLNWRTDKVGILLSGVTGTKNLANDFAGAASGSEARTAEDQSLPNIAGQGVDYRKGNTFVADSHGWDFFKAETERERTGYNFAIEADLSEGFTFVAEAFVTHTKSYARQVGLDITNRWLGEQNSTDHGQGDGYGPLDSADVPQVSGNGFWHNGNNGWHGSAIGMPTNVTGTATGKDGTKWATASQYNVDALWVDTYSINNVTTTDSKNFNVELKYDNGGPFTGGLRAIKGTASNLALHANVQGDYSNWQGSQKTQLNPFYPKAIADQFTRDTRHTEVGVDGGYYVNPNPEGYGSDPQLTLSRANHVQTWGGFDRVIGGGLGPNSTLADYMANEKSQTIGSYALEYNVDASSDLSALSAHGKYEFESDDLFFTDVEVGLRSSKRSVDTTTFMMFSPFYPGSSNYGTSPQNPSINISGCSAQWKAIDQAFDGGDNHSQCSAGERLVGRENDPTSFTPYTILQPTKLDAYGAKVMFVDSLGSHVKGIPGFYAVDPHTFDDPIAFANKAFGSSAREISPAQSYDISLEENSAYVFSNFKAGIVSGNLGARIIQTTINSNAYKTTGVTKANGDITISDGRVAEEKSFTDVLPALNMAIDLTDSIKVRFAAAKTKQELDLDLYGSSLSISTAPDINDPTKRIPSGWSSNGNINLKPWRATNYDTSVEYYFGDASMISFGGYYINVSSFPETKEFNRDLFVNGQTYNLKGTGPIEGKGGKVSGLELGTKLAFSDITSNFLANFGVDANFTYSPSEKAGNSSDIEGKKYPFINNSKETSNLALWYQHDKLQARVALNTRSDQYIGDNSSAYGYSTYRLGSTFVDVNVSYDVMENVTVYLQGANVTSTDSKTVYRLKNGLDQDADYNDFEARYNIGVRAKF
jgi:TonB-dependent receptor